MKIIVFPMGKQAFWKKSFFDINIDVVWILEPTWLCFAPPKPTKAFPKNDPNMELNFDRFLVRFLDALGFLLEAKKIPRRPKSPPRWAQEATKKHVPPPRFSVLATKTVPRPPQGHPKTDFKSPNTDFSSILMPTWLLFESKIPPKSNYTSISKGT